MRKPRRGAAGLLLALMLVIPAPVLTGCRGEVTKAVEQTAEDAAQHSAGQWANNLGKRAAPAGGGGAATYYGECKLSGKCK